MKTEDIEDEVANQQLDTFKIDPHELFQSQYVPINLQYLKYLLNSIKHLQNGILSEYSKYL